MRIISRFVVSSVVVGLMATTLVVAPTRFDLAAHAVAEQVGPTGSCSNPETATPYAFPTPSATVNDLGVVTVGGPYPTDKSLRAEVEFSGAGVEPEIFTHTPTVYEAVNRHNYWVPSVYKFRPSVPGPKQRVRVRLRATFWLDGHLLDQCTKWSDYSNSFDINPSAAQNAVPLCNQQSRWASDALGQIRYWIPATSVVEEIDNSRSPVISSTLNRDAADNSPIKFSCPAGGLYNPQSTLRSLVVLGDDPFTAGDQTCKGTVSGVQESRQISLQFGQVGPCYIHSIPSEIYDNVNFSGGAETITITSARTERARSVPNWGSTIRVFVGAVEIASNSITRNSSTSVSFTVTNGQFASGPQTVFITDETSPAYVTRINIKPITTDIYADCAIGRVVAPNEVEFTWYPVTQETYSESECVTSSSGTPIEPRPGTGINNFSFTRGPVYGGVYPYNQGYRGTVDGHEIQSWTSSFHTDRSTPSATTVDTSGNGRLEYFLEVNNFEFGATPSTTSNWNYDVHRGIVQITPLNQSALVFKYHGFLDEQVTDNSLSGDTTTLLNFGGTNDGRGNPWNAKIYAEKTLLEVTGGQGEGLITGSTALGNGAIAGDSCSITSDLVLLASQTTPGHTFECVVTIKKAASGLFRAQTITRIAEIRIVPNAAAITRSLEPVVVEDARLRQWVTSGTLTSQTALDLKFEDVATGQDLFTNIMHEVQVKDINGNWVQFSSSAGTGKFGYCATSTAANASWVCEKYGSFGQRRSVPPITPFVQGQAYTFRVKTTALSQQPVYSDEFELIADYAPAPLNLSRTGGTTAVYLSWALPETSLPAGDNAGVNYHLNNGIGAFEVQVSRDAAFTSPTTITGREWATSYTWSDSTADSLNPYYFRVRAIGNQLANGSQGSVARSTWSNVIEYTLSAPIISTAQQVGNRIEFEWTSNQPVAQFPVWDAGLSQYVNHVDGIAGFQFQIVNQSQSRFAGPWAGSINELTVDRYRWSCSGTPPPAENPNTPARETSMGKSPEAGESCRASFNTVCSGSSCPAPGCEIRGLEIGETYFVRVRSYNFLGAASGQRFSPWSNVELVTFGRAPQAPSIEADPGPCRLTVRWTPPADKGGLPIDNFEVEYVKVLSQNPPTFDEATRTVLKFPVKSNSPVNQSSDDIETSAVITDLEGGSSYFVRSFVVNSVGRSSTGPNSTVLQSADGCSETGAPTSSFPGEVVSYLTPTDESDLLTSGDVGAQLSIDGEFRTVDTQVDDGTLSVVDDSLEITMDLEGQRGEVDAIPDVELQTLRFYTDGNGVASGTGFKPGTIAEVWLFSDQIFLGNTEVQADGSWEKVFRVPSDIELGLHTIQAEGVTVLNEERSLLAAVRVAEAPASGSPTNTNPGGGSSTVTVPTVESNLPTRPSLPATGRDLVLWPAVVMLGGAAICGLVRRRLVR